MCVKTAGSLLKCGALEVVALLKFTRSKLASPRKVAFRNVGQPQAGAADLDIERKDRADADARDQTQDQEGDETQVDLRLFSSAPPLSEACRQSGLRAR